MPTAPWKAASGPAAGSAAASSARAQHGHGHRPRSPGTVSATDDAVSEKHDAVPVSRRSRNERRRGDALSAVTGSATRVAEKQRRRQRQVQRQQAARGPMRPRSPVTVSGHGHGRGCRSPVGLNQPPRHRPTPVEERFSFTRPRLVDLPCGFQQSECRTRLERRTVCDTPVVLSTPADVPGAFGQVQCHRRCGSDQLVGHRLQRTSDRCCQLDHDFRGALCDRVRGELRGRRGDVFHGDLRGVHAIPRTAEFDRGKGRPGDLSCPCPDRIRRLFAFKNTAEVTMGHIRDRFGVGSRPRPTGSRTPVTVIGYRPRVRSRTEPHRRVSGRDSGSVRFSDSKQPESRDGHGCGPRHGGPMVAWASSPRMVHQRSERRPHGGQDAHRTMESSVRDSDSDSRDRGSGRVSDCERRRARDGHGHGHRPRCRSRTK
jgi:hypothetical protein